MIDHVRQVIARTLRVPLATVGAWELVARQESQHGFPGRLRAELKVTLSGVATDVMHKLYTNDAGSWRMERLDVSIGDASRGLGTSTNQTLILLYGKETQHIFKAAYQMFTVRGKQKRKRK